ncbi:MAG TPA: carbamate kinase [Gemmatimonadaceae bacterium]|jgi:carbamate kinase|nr:carbamate kinase [Gemmatimonadaceae bacterium]
MTQLHHRTAVVALGGNALAPAGETSTVYDQFRHTRESLAPIVELALAGWSVCIVHGNGPQVGEELVRNELAREEANPLPLGVLVAATAGWIGYMVQQSLDNALARAAASGAADRAERRGVATIITQVQVDPTDPALRNPTKFIGRALSDDRARELEAEGHVVRRDGHGNLRRVVGSPAPQAICELDAIKSLVEAGMLVVACGGGGAPVYRHPTLGWEGIDAVVDKDLAAAVLARDLEAALLLILTDVDAVYADWGTAQQRPLRQLTIADAERMDAEKAFGEGSMAPKIRAAVDFVRRTGGRAIITSLARGQAAVRGEAGTTITAETA